MTPIVAFMLGTVVGILLSVGILAWIMRPSARAFPKDEWEKRRALYAPHYRGIKTEHRAGGRPL